ncbi:UNVERIFIED_CONTAM: hypothetical protein GTU68_006895 [Idotea baltica]|nr:hypothetical protein [Idotea baltica]
MELQPGDEQAGKFSFTDTPRLTKQRPCHIAYTSAEVHETLKTGFDRSPMFSGRIQGIGPRYCPSIEDKIERFAERDRHQLFVEPEGWDTCEVYVNGFSSSLPEEIQFKALRKVVGFENVKMFRPGYAIEYDFFQPTQLTNSLETRLIHNLFFAGQINGTTGYEEAAGQGMMAGINAHLKINNQEPFILKRSEAYIGVLIDDLVHKGTKEPYRMFTSRAEYRILLRQDNADMRLSHLAANLGIRDMDDRMDVVRTKEKEVQEIRTFIEELSVDPGQINALLEAKASSPMRQKVQNYNEGTIETAEIDIKYEGYIRKEEEMVEKMNRLENVKLNNSFDYNNLDALSSEAREKLNQLKPRTIGQASRISGISPADVSVLLVFMGR